MAITSDRLLEGVKRRILMPASNVTLTDTDILAMADDVIKSRVIPVLESVNQEYFVTTERTALVASQSEYSIPYRAVGRALRDLKLEDSSGNLSNIALIAIEDAQVYDPSALTIGFYFKGDKIRLVPDVPSTVSTQYLQIWYRLPPSRLVSVSSAALVTSVSAPTVTVSSVPTTITAGVTIDFIQGKSGNTIYAIDKAVTNVSGTTITFASGVVPSDLAAGDYLSVSETSPVINFVPNEAYPYLESCVCYRILNTLSDFEGAKALLPDISIEEKNLEKLIEPRIDGEPTIIINRTGLVRGNKFSQRRWLYGG